MESCGRGSTRVLNTPAATRLRRVFPIQANGHNRVLISYEELLPAR